MTADTIDLPMLLTAAELAALTGKNRSDAHMRALRAMGITFRQRPDGSVAVLRRHVETILGGASAAVVRREPEFQP